MYFMFFSEGRPFAVMLRSRRKKVVLGPRLLGEGFGHAFYTSEHVAGFD